MAGSGNSTTGSTRAARVRLFLRDIIGPHEGETIVVIGHSATRVGLEHWMIGTPLEEIVAAPRTYEPGRSYALTAEALARIAGREEAIQ